MLFENYSHSSYTSSRIIGHILKNKQDHTINQNENEDENEKKSYGYNINRPRSRHGHKYSKHRKSQYDGAYMYQATPKQHLKLNSCK